MKITIIGGGNMGITYAKAFLKSSIIAKTDLTIIEKFSERAASLRSELGVNVIGDIEANIGKSNIIIIAVKPQDFRILASQIAEYLIEGQLIISIMAGINMEKIATLLNFKNIVRAMPNTPAQLGYGIAGYTPASVVNTQDLDLAKRLLETTGKALLIKEESKLDAVTAVSGSGPAYFYYFIKNMVQAGVNMGLDNHTAAELAKETMMGSYQIMSSSNMSLDEMIKMVTSKGGTTEAALNCFEANNVGSNIIKALEAAEKRAKELSQGA
jgi:pyrroline-5-carboxylate reductase